LSELFYKVNNYNSYKNSTLSCLYLLLISSTCFIYAYNFYYNFFNVYNYLLTVVKLPLYFSNRLSFSSISVNSDLLTVYNYLMSFDDYYC